MKRLAKKSRTGQITALASAAVALGITGSVFATPVPLVQYTFNEGTGTTAASTGSASGPTTLTLSGGAAFTGAGTGVSGQAGDTALSVATATTTTASASGGDVNGTDGLSSFTLQGWYQVGKNTKPGGEVYNDLTSSGGNGGIAAWFTTGGTTKGSFIVNIKDATIGSNFTSSSVYTAGTATAGSGWVFFAVTYDGTQTTNNLTFYIGGTSTAVTTNGTFSTTIGPLAANAANLIIGNSGAAFSFDGSLDDMRLYGSASDGSGALTSAQLEAIRASDVAGATPIPEPAAASAAGLLGLMMLGTRRRK